MDRPTDRRRTSILHEDERLLLGYYGLGAGRDLRKLRLAGSLGIDAADCQPDLSYVRAEGPYRVLEQGSGWLLLMVAQAVVDVQRASALPANAVLTPSPRPPS